jgi:hypothetical protein
LVLPPVAREVGLGAEGERDVEAVGLQRFAAQVERQPEVLFRIGEPARLARGDAQLVVGGGDEGMLRGQRLLPDGEGALQEGQRFAVPVLGAQSVRLTGQGRGDEGMIGTVSFLPDCLGPSIQVDGRPRRRPGGSGRGRSGRFKTLPQ